MATLSEAVSQMRAAGMPDFATGHPLLNTSKIVRYGPKKKGWYRLFEHVSSKSGRKYVSGAFGLHGQINTTKISMKLTDFDLAERDDIQLVFRQAAARDQKKREARAAAAAERAKLEWAAAKTDGPWPYLNRKGVGPEGARSLIDDARDVSLSTDSRNGQERSIVRSKCAIGGWSGPSKYRDQVCVKPEGVRARADGTLVVPMRRYGPSLDEAPELVGLQKITPDGEKRYSLGMDREGAMLLLANLSDRERPVLVVCEGLATGLSIRMATQGSVAVAVAFDAGGLLPVGRALRARWPGAHLMFATDDDWRTEIPKGTPFNTGVVKAHAAARALGNASVAVPLFPAEGRQDEATDYNDLHALDGLEAVASQLIGPLLKAGWSHEDAPPVPLAKAIPDGVRGGLDADSPPDAGFPPLGEAKGEVVPELLKKAEGKSKRPPLPPEYWETLEHMLQRYALLYPTESLWDFQKREIVSARGVALAWPAYWKAWKESPRRKMVDYTSVVFDPSGRLGEPDYINLFDGFALEPKAGECGRIRALLSHLCSGDAEIIAWLVRWLAWPLQHPGTKMTTSVIIHGDEGSGKNMFAGVMRRIYGKYAAIISQDQIDGKYNEWASRRLFVIANEVNTRADLRSNKGRIKNMISEDEIQIEGKFQPVRQEANSMNLMWFSNEIIPMIIDVGDRRNLVMWTPPKLSTEFYAECAAEIENFGAAAFYDYLLKVPLGDQRPTTWPPMTAAKHELITVGKPSTSLFWDAWRAGLTPFPYCTAPSLEVYDAYRLFCARAGERMPYSATKFLRELHRHVVKQSAVRFSVPGSDRVEIGALLIIPNDTPDTSGQSQRHVYGRSVARFRAALEAAKDGSWVVLAPVEVTPAADLEPIPF